MKTRIIYHEQMGIDNPLVYWKNSGDGPCSWDGYRSAFKTIYNPFWLMNALIGWLRVKTGRYSRIKHHGIFPLQDTKVVGDWWGPRREEK